MKTHITRFIASLGWRDRFIYLPAAMAFAWLGGIGVTLGVQSLVEDRRDPVAFKRVEALNSPVKVGDNLVVRIWRDKVRSCPVDSERIVMDQDGHVTELAGEVSAGGPVDEAYVDWEYPTHLLPAADYQMDVALTYWCPDGLHQMKQPPVRFRIVE